MCSSEGIFSSSREKHLQFEYALAPVNDEDFEVVVDVREDLTHHFTNSELQISCVLRGYKIAGGGERLVMVRR